MVILCILFSAVADQDTGTQDIYSSIPREANNSTRAPQTDAHQAGINIAGPSHVQGAERIYSSPYSLQEEIILEADERVASSST